MITLDARQLMEPALQPLLASESAVSAARRMRALGVQSIPVCGADNEFLGMVSDRDIVVRCVAEAIDPRELAVGRLIQQPQQTVDVDQPADSALLGMVLKQPLGLLPVVDNGVLVGAITLAGIAEYLIDDDEIETKTGRRWWPIEAAQE